MRAFIIPVIYVLSFVSIGRGQSKTEQKIYNKEFKWTIFIPSGFDTVSAKKWEQLQNRGAEAIEKTYDAKLEGRAETIFVFQSDQFNYFESNYQPYEISKDGDYLESCNEVNKILYETMKAQINGATFDSSSSTKNIDGLTFQTFILTITLPNKMVMKWHMFSRLFDKRDFTVNIMTIDRNKEKELLTSWMNSKFGK